jgi:hypothetical protein
MQIERGAELRSRFRQQARDAGARIGHRGAMLTYGQSLINISFSKIFSGTLIHQNKGKQI